MSKKRLATVWLDGCSGCHMSLLDMDERLLALAGIADLVYSPLVDTKEFPENVDLTLVEGFTREVLPRLEVVRPEAGRDPLYLTDTAILAIATNDAPRLHDAPAIPLLPLADVGRIGEFICKTVGLSLLDSNTPDN